MRVLQVINSLATGGAEKLLLETIPRYRDAGIIMDILLLNGKETPFLLDLKSTTDCNIYSLSDGSVYNPFHIFRIRKYLKNYNIIHVHLFPSLYWVALSTLLLRTKPVLIFTEHNTTNRRLESLLLRALDRFIYASYNRVVCISETIETIVQQKLKLQKTKTVIIKNGVAIATIKNASPMERSQISETISNNDKLLIQVAGFRDQKDQPTLIKSLQYLPKHYKLLLVGDGKNKPVCSSLVQTLGLTQRVFFLGIRTDVPSLLKTSDIVVLSSHHEGLSLSSIEGMASGKPFVASDVPGLKEIVKDAGILVPVGKEKALASEIKKLIENPTLLKAVVDSCQKRAESYDIKNMVNNHIKLYNSLC